MMDREYYIGRLKRWNDSKGFGFIQNEKGGKDTFIHISVLKGSSRRPLVGDKIIYQVSTDNEGKNRAVNAKIEGVGRISPKVQVSNSKIQKKRSWIRPVLLLVLLFVIGFLLYTIFFSGIGTPKNFQDPLLRTSAKESPNEKFSCKEKKFCSQMSSCKEAKFYLNNCPGTQMDGDHDGVPCEKQWCN